MKINKKIEKKNHTFIKVTTRNFLVFMKQSHDYSDDDKFPVTTNKTLSEKTAVFM